MEGDDSQGNSGIPFAGEYLKRYEANVAKARAIKDWRTTEFEAGRPSSLTDYFRAHGLCPHCHGIGIARNENGIGYKAVGWDGKTQLYEKCRICGGTGEPSKLTRSPVKPSPL